MLRISAIFAFCLFFLFPSMVFSGIVQSQEGNKPVLQERNTTQEMGKWRLSCSEPSWDMPGICAITNKQTKPRDVWMSLSVLNDDTYGVVMVIRTTPKANYGNLPIANVSLGRFLPNNEMRYYGALFLTCHKEFCGAAWALGKRGSQVLSDKEHILVTIRTRGLGGVSFVFSLLELRNELERIININNTE